MKITSLFLVVFMAIAVEVAAQDYSTLLKGKRLILEDTTCAGIEFKDSKTMMMYAEMECSRGLEPTLEAKIKWLTPNLFVAIEKNRIQENCPPRNWLYEIQNISGDKITIKEFWTGWGEFKDEILKYKIISTLLTNNIR